jgi:hypothetical protein
VGGGDNLFLSQLKYFITYPLIEKPVPYWQESDKNKKTIFANRKFRPHNTKIHMSSLWENIFSDAT